MGLKIGPFFNYLYYIYIMNNTVTATEDSKTQILKKLETTAYLSKKYNSDVEIAFFLELDSFLDNFRSTYYLD